MNNGKLVFSEVAMRRAAGVSGAKFKTIYGLTEAAHPMRFSINR